MGKRRASRRNHRRAGRRGATVSSLMKVTSTSCILMPTVYTVQQPSGQSYYGTSYALSSILVASATWSSAAAIFTSARIRQIKVTWLPLFGDSLSDTANYLPYEGVMCYSNNGNLLYTAPTSNTQVVQNANHWWTFRPIPSRKTIRLTFPQSKLYTSCSTMGSGGAATALYYGAVCLYLSTPKASTATISVGNLLFELVVEFARS